MRKNIILFFTILIWMVGKSIDINAANYCIQEEADLLIPANTAIPLVLDYSINSKKAKRGNIVNFKVAQEIYIGYSCGNISNGGDCKSIEKKMLG